MQTSCPHRRLRPVAVCFPFAGNRVGGSHISAAKLIAELDRTRFSPLAVVHKPGGKVEQLLADNGVAAECAPLPHLADSGRFSVLRDSLGALPLAAFLRSRGTEIVHTNDGRSHLSWALPTRLAGAKLVWHHRGNPNARGLRFLAPWVADWVIAVSHFAAPRPGLWSAATKCTVVPSPFDTEHCGLDRRACHDAACAELGVATETKLIGFFGTLVPRKRPLVFVRAIAALQKRAPTLPVLGLLFGGVRFGHDEAVTRLVRELGVGSSIRLMGFRYPPERWLAACDTLIVPAVEEPFGRTLIEAMLIGTPVVATSSGGNPEAIEDARTGFLVPVDAPDAMADRALELLTRPLLHQAIATAARADSEWRFGVARHVNAVMEIYDRLLEERRSIASLTSQPAVSIDAHE